MNKELNERIIEFVLDEIEIYKGRVKFLQQLNIDKSKQKHELKSVLREIDEIINSKWSNKSKIKVIKKVLSEYKEMRGDF